MVEFIFAAVLLGDLALRRLSRAGDFIWSERLAAVYPREAFWWLYGSPSVG